MSASTPTTPLATAAAKTSKPGKTLQVILRLPSSLLDKFPTTLPRKQLAVNPSPARAAAVAAPPPDSSSGQDGSEQNATPAPDVKTENGSLAPPANGLKRKFGPGSRGVKRVLLGPDGLPRPRGKPGPKKRPRPDEEQADDSNKTPWTGPNPTAAQKLGPKANQGAINAGLRALDRTGKPCRRWERKGYELKSFTGVTWLMPQWSTPKLHDESAGDGQSDATTSQDGKADNSAVGSASSNADNDANGRIMTDMASSPAPDSRYAVAV